MGTYNDDLMKDLPSEDMYNLCVTQGFSSSENFTDEERQKIENKASELMDKVKEEFDSFIESMGFENAMGMIIHKK
jgi:hypothetical protein